MGTFPSTTYPLKVAIMRTGATDAVAAADSTAFWALLREFETTFGRSLFTPALEQSGWNPMLPGESMRGYIVVRLQSAEVPASASGTGSNGGIGTAGIVYDQHHPLGGWRGSLPTTLSLSNFDAAFGFVQFKFPVFMRSAETVKHEFMHVMGVGHGCSWVSTQSTCGMRPADNSPTAEDVGYWEYEDAVRIAEKTLKAQFGLYPALFGQRALIDGLAPVPALWTLP
jgi:hypothetical protein